MKNFLKKENDEKESINNTQDGDAADGSIPPCHNLHCLQQ